MLYAKKKKKIFCIDNFRKMKLMFYIFDVHNYFISMKFNFTYFISSALRKIKY